MRSEMVVKKYKGTNCNEVEVPTKELINTVQCTNCGYPSVDIVLGEYFIIDGDTYEYIREEVDENVDGVGMLLSDYEQKEKIKIVDNLLIGYDGTKSGYEILIKQYKEVFNSKGFKYKNLSEDVDNTVIGKFLDDNIFKYLDEGIQKIVKNSHKDTNYIFESLLGEIDINYEQYGVSIAESVICDGNKNNLMIKQSFEDLLKKGVITKHPIAFGYNFEGANLYSIITPKSLLEDKITHAYMLKNLFMK